MSSAAMSDIVRSTAGRDAGELFLVLKVEDGFAYLANGKGRKRESPKKKKLKHLSYVAEGEAPAAEQLRRGETPTNRGIIRALAQYRAEPQAAEEGS